MSRIGVITGSGTYALPGFEGGPQDVETRFGTVCVSVGTFADTDVLHISRHEDGHRRLSNHVNYRANIAALQELGADAVVATTVCGSVDRDLPLGSLIAFDDLHFLVNRLPDGALCTFYDTSGEAGRAHWIFEHPFCEAARVALADGAREAGHPVRDGGCYGHVDGPRFNTKAEIRTLAHAGVTAVSQTAGPETVLCGEVELPYALLGYATDYANGVKDEPTPVDELMGHIEASVTAFADTLSIAVPRLAQADLQAVGGFFRFD